MEISRSKFLAITLAGVAALALAGPGAAQSGAPVTLRVAWTASFANAGQAIADAFHTKNPNITIDFTKAVFTDYRTLLTTQLPSGTAPDVFWVDSGSADPETQGQLAPQGYLVDLSDQPWIKSLPDRYKNAYTQYQGKSYYLPMASSALGTIYNMDLMKKMGLEVPTTYSQLLDNCRKARAAGKDYFSWVLSGGSGNNLYYSMIVSNGLMDKGDWFDSRMKGGPKFADTPEWVDALTKVVEMINAGCMQPRGAAVATAYEDAFRALATENALSTPVGTAPMTRIRDAAPGKHFELHPFPMTEDPNDMRVATYPAGGPALNAKAEGAVREAGLAFLAFAASPEGGALSAANDASIPRSPNDGVGSLAQSGNAVVSKMVDAGLGRVAFPGRLPGPTVTDAMNNASQTLAQGGSAKDWLDAMDTAWDEALKSKN